MALSITKDLRTKTAVKPPRILIHGPPGLGKTTLAAEFPSPVLLDIEGGRPANVSPEAVPGFDSDQLGSYGEVMQAMSALYSDDHDRQTLIVDALDRLEPLLWGHTAAENEWPNGIETPGYGKGYLAADAFWREFLDGCNALRRDRGMAIVMICHSAIERFDDPQAASYSRYDIRLHKRALAMVQDEVDAILFLNQDATLKQNDPKAKQGPGARVRAEGGGTRWVYCEGRPAFAAKNRYGLPDRFVFQPGNGYSTIAPYLTRQPTEQREAA